MYETLLFFLWKKMIATVTSANPIAQYIFMEQNVVWMNLQLHKHHRSLELQVAAYKTYG